MRPTPLPPETGGQTSVQRGARVGDVDVQPGDVDSTEPAWQVLTERPLNVFPDDDNRRMWNIVARKIPYARRDVAREVMPDETAAETRDFLALGRAADTPDNDTEFPIGSTASYALMLTDAEAARFKRASNALSVEPSVRMSRPPIIEESRFLMGGRS